MSADLGAVQAGFVNNFAYGTISLTANTSVELVDQSHNTTSTKPEAVYANELIVPAGATLNLNNLHLYVRGDQISGTVAGRDGHVVPVGGSLALNTPTPGTLTPAGAVNDWTFYGTAGESITIQLNPGGGGSNPAVSPTLNWGQVALLRLRAAARWRRPAAPARARSRRSAGSPCRPAAPTRSRSQAPPGRRPAPATTSSRPTTSRPTSSTLTVNQQENGTIGNRLRRRSVGLHGLGRAAGAAQRDQHQRRRRSST